MYLSFCTATIGLNIIWRDFTQCSYVIFALNLSNPACELPVEMNRTHAC